MKNGDIEIWLMISRALFNNLVPKDEATEILGMDKNTLLKLIERETPRVYDALVAMALAFGDDEVRLIFDRLGRDTVVALCSRWQRYHAEWKRMRSDPASYLWFPPDQKDLWRAIFLAMTDDIETVASAMHRLWP